jgi:hypothetical protein
MDIKELDLEIELLEDRDEAAESVAVVDCFAEYCCCCCSCC